jgi:putative phosphoesterase
MKIAVISDTHSHLDEQIISQLDSADEIWHAGDIGSLEIVEKLSKLNGRLRMVYGNIDDLSIRNLTDEHLFFKLDDIGVLIIHIADKPPKYNRIVKNLVEEHQPDILVAGHSHILRVINDKENNLLFINPGACGHQGFHKIRTLIRFEINKGRPQNLEVIELGKRGQLNK